MNIFSFPSTLRRFFNLIIKLNLNYTEFFNPTNSVLSSSVLSFPNNLLIPLRYFVNLIFNFYLNRIWFLCPISSVLFAISFTFIWMSITSQSQCVAFSVHFLVSISTILSSLSNQLISIVNQLSLFYFHYPSNIIAFFSV